MLDFCDRNDETEDVLLKYVECNPNNLNAHIYLCVYLCNYSADTEKITHHLQVWMKLCTLKKNYLENHTNLVYLHVLIVVLNSKNILSLQGGIF